MKRRTLLAGVASSVPLTAGCTGGFLSNGSNGSSENPAERVDVGLESDFEKFDAAFEFETVRGPTADHPPRIGATFENTSDRKLTYSFNAQAPLSPMPDEAEIPALYLRIPPEDGYDADDCWQLQSVDWPSGTETVELAPGETVSGELDVFASPEVKVEDHCLPTGTAQYRQVVTRISDGGTRVVDSVRFSVTLR